MLEFFSSNLDPKIAPYPISDALNPKKAFVSPLSENGRLKVSGN